MVYTEKMMKSFVAIVDFAFAHLHSDSEFSSNLTAGSVLIQSSKRREVLGRNGWSKLFRNQGICIGRITNYQNLKHSRCYQ